MKKAAIISGFLTIILLALILTGTLHFQDTAQAAIKKGNRLYSTGDYPGALEVYKQGLADNPMDLNLNYNSGQAAYLMGDYQQAATFYTNAPGTLDRYLNQGNSYFRLGDNASDANQKTQIYQQALKTYKQGILKFPENVDLKYNYEYVKSKLDQLNNQDQQNQDQQNQDQQNQDQSQGQQGQNQQNQDQSQDQQGQDQQNQDQQNQDQNQGQQGQDQQNQDQQSQDQQNQDQNQQASGSDQSQDQNGDQNSSTINEADPSQASQADSEIAQALAMLEQQEEESLKNNQEVNGQAKGDEGNGW